MPDETFRYCSNAKELRQAINAVPIEIITYGILANRELCTGEILFPKSFLNVNTREDIGKDLIIEKSVIKKLLPSEKICI